MYEIGGRTSMKNKKRIITLGAAAVTTIAVLGGTFAYFTGYDSKD